MTEQEQRIAIAESCGWTQADITHRVGKRIVQYGFPQNRGLAYEIPLPDYCNDLNAMHEAVIRQSGDFLIRYRNTLADIAGAQHYHNATAAQRSEAFLKTIGKWEESK